jgi:hypothetical protein
MAEQPALSNVSIFRTVRAYRGEELRHDAIKPITHKMRGLVVSVPAREVLVQETRNASLSDAFRFGHPVVRHLRSVCTLDDVTSGVSGLEFPTRIGRDVFLAKDENNLADDLHQEVRETCGVDADASLVGGV